MSEQTAVRYEVPISKLDEDRRIVFGWANVMVDKTGVPPEDTQGDLIVTKAQLDAFEDAVYDFVKESGSGDALHVVFDVSNLVESVFFSPEKAAMMGVEKGQVPVYGWWVGFKVHDDATWDLVKSGFFRAFSIVGEGLQEALNAAA